MNSKMQTEILLEIALRIGASLDLDDMLRDTVTTALRLLNCSGAQVMQAEVDAYSQALVWTPILTRPRPLARQAAHLDFLTEVDLPNHADEWPEWAQTLPLAKEYGSTSRLLFNLPGFGALALEKNGSPFDPGFIRSLQVLFNKLGHAATACVATTENVRRRKELEARNPILSMIAQGRALPEVLAALCLFTEEMDPNIRSSVLLYDPDRRMLIPGAAPSLPDDYNALLAAGVPIGPEAGSCGTAAYNRQLTVTADIQTDPRWTPYPESLQKAREHNIHACWSIPIFASTGAVLGTLANYSRHIGNPTPENLRFAAWAVDIAALAIEGHRDKEALRESEERYRSIFDESIASIYLFDANKRFIDTNQAGVELLGYSREELLQMSMPDVDVDPVPVTPAHEELLAGGRLVNFEHRLKRKDGTVITVLNNSSPLTDDSGQVIGMLSTLIDITERKKNQERLFFQSQVLDCVNEAIVATDLDGNILYWGRGAERQYGYSADEVMGRPYHQFAGSIEPRDEAAFRQRVLDQGSWSGEHLQKHRDGSFFWSSTYIFVLRDANGQPTGFIGLDHDITERKRTEAEQAQERSKRELISRVATTAVKSTSLYAFMNELVSLLGQSLDVSRCYVFTHHHEKDLTDNTVEWTAPGITPQIDNLQGVPTNAIPWWIKTLMQGEDIRFSNVEDIPDEGTKNVLRAQDIVSILAIPLFIGKRYYGFIGFDECRHRREWTQQERDVLAEVVRILMGVWADEELRQSEQRFKGILQNVATVAVQGYALDGTVRYWNRASEAFYGYSAEEVIGRNMLELGFIPPSMRDDLRTEIRRVAETGQVPPAYELELTRKDGSPIPIYSSYALVDVPGQETEFFCIDIDLSDQKRIEAEREQLERQFIQAQKMESIGRLAGGVAHDFNNMLMVILGEAEMALDRSNVTGELRESLKEIQNAAQRSADLTRQLLAFARKQTISPRVLDLNETVEGMLNMLRRLIGEHIVLEWQPEEGVGKVFIDPSQVDQMLANLCVNARDAITDTGRITIETRSVTIRAPVTNPNDTILPGQYALVAVSDDGCGIDAADRSQLFDLFFTTKETGKGTGLGLAMIYGIVKQNRGHIEVKSEPGHGSTFNIYLPKHTAQQNTQSEQKQTATPPTKGTATILLAEDEPAILTTTSRLLKGMGYTVIPAATPGEAIQRARAHQGEIDLLITDVVMPEMNGRDLAKNLLPLYPDIKCLFMSGYTADIIAHQGILNEGVHFIQKPYKKSDLAAKIREALGEGN